MNPEHARDERYPAQNQPITLIFDGKHALSNETPMDSQSLKGTPAVAASDTQSSAARAVAGLENHTPMMQQYLRLV
ncbi:hypothetical protein [Burkholderia ubonensis]|uniref:hypothetical protein n=1 Tax=Burkholderia ubonensis TaxID=101571 RepID=UPI000A691835|nr:hypothetical protein [Burkholderia ubonensis]